ncbi:uncharacterized protein LOC127855855 isoform X2 [Dreissena polymorpha]|uniref:uncharacterized protein LOC127855855 isoform X2 n=1 Tax=Dreissena polymorpha TaxID=45954 RepID=UPI0022646FBF|nr:uncharacterized protein LOC127855855 isoform X2 [Dreissena polymorpha]
MWRSYNLELVILFGYCFCNLYAVPYSCYADVCNADTSAQFCDVIYRRCRRCEDVRTDCFSRMMTYNCTDYCYDMKHGHDMEQLRVSGCNTPSPPEHGRYHVNTIRVSYNTTLMVTCDTGYSLLDGDQYICNNFSMWTGTRPFCKDSNCDQNLISTDPPHQKGDIATNIPQSTEQTMFIRNSHDTFGFEHT